MDTVNGITIAEADIVAGNGLIHVIDRYLIPIQSDKTVADYLEHPDIPHLEFQ